MFTIVYYSLLLRKIAASSRRDADFRRNSGRSTTKVFTIAYYCLLSAARARGQQEEEAEEEGGREGSEAGTLAWGRGKEAETGAR